VIETARRAEFAGMDTAAQESILEIVAGESSRLKSLAVMDAGGWFVAASGVEDFPLYTTKSYANEPYFHVPFEQGEIYYQEPRFYPSEQLLSVDVSVPIESDTGDRVGVLLGTLVLNHLVEMVADYPLEEGMTALVVDREGRVLAHSSIDLFALEEGPLSLDYSNYPLVKAIEAGDIGVFPEHEHDGVPYYGTYAILESNGWGVVVGRPMGLVLAEANALSGRLLTANAVLFAIALLVALLLARQIMAGQRMAEQALRESEERYKAVFENSGTAMATIEEDMTMSLVNHQFETLSGYFREEMEGKKSWTELVAPEELERLQDYNRRSSLGLSVPAEYETALVHKSGEKRQVFVSASVVPGSSQTIVSLVDLTERRRMELEVRRQREHFRSLFANSPEGVVSFDFRGAVVDVNSAFERMFGYRCEDVVGRKLDDLIVPKGLEKEAREATRRALRGSVSVPETTRRRADGSTIRVSISGAGVILDGKKTGGFGIYRDMTDYRKAQDRLQESFIDMVKTIVRSMGSLDPYTSGHQRRVARLADLVGRELGMDDDRLQGLYIGALLHDIGKLSVPSTILTKPGSLTKQEWNIIRAHPRRGYDILKEATLPWPVEEMALRHHERLDGSGYPDGIKGPELSLEVRILGVCDVVEAMSSDRPYRAARPAQEVIQEIRTGSGQRYDPQVVEAALKVVEGGAFLLWASGVDTGGDEPEEEKRPSHVGSVAAEGATVVERTAESVGHAPGREPAVGNRLEEQPREGLLNLAETLSRAMASRDPSTTNHQRRVADLAVQVGSRLGLSAERLWALGLGGLLHDVGKIAVPELILTRPGRLSNEERELVRTHPEAGHEILRGAGLPPIVPLLALHHHELLDGSGYPQGLSGDVLTMEDRILSVCNVVEAMGAHRSYRRGLGKKEVIAEIVAGRGTRYEPDVVDCVLSLLESGEFVLGE